jgi:hypothetical protein
MALPRLLSFVAAAMLIPATALAGSDRFVAIDSAEMRISDSNDEMSLVVVGRVGDGTARTGQYWLPYSRDDVRKRLEYCHRLAVLVMSKPGKYRLEIDTFAWSQSTLQGCRLVATP